MTGADFAFYAPALGAVAFALRSALSASASRAAQWTLAASLALSGVWMQAEAAGIAALQVALVTTAAAWMLLDPAAMHAQEHAREERFQPLRRAAIPALAWLVPMLRVVLMTRWPLPATAPASWLTPGPTHHFVLGLLVLALALANAASRRDLRGAATGVALAASGAATLLLAPATAAPSGGVALAAAALAAGWLVSLAAVALAGRDTADGEREGDVATPPSSFGTGVSFAVTGVAMALLAGAW
jgi:NADH:ubiquinone oxidoreductase subunit 6 (subunit J)